MPVRKFLVSAAFFKSLTGSSMEAGTSFGLNTNGRCEFLESFRLGIAAMTLCIQVLSPLDSVLLDSAFASFCFANIGLGSEFVTVYHHFMGLSPLASIQKTTSSVRHLQSNRPHVLRLIKLDP